MGIPNDFGKYMSSGGWNSTGKREADGLHKISVDFLNKHGYFKGGYCSGVITWTSGWDESKSSIGISSTMNENTRKVHLNYTITKYDGEKRDIDYDVQIVETTCNYGGKRYWFVCPLIVNGRYCRRRVGKLYHGNGDYFGCRHCYNLTYASRNQGGRYKGFVSAVDLDEMEAKIKRYYYNGKPTKKYLKLLKMEERFNDGFLEMAIRLGVFDKKGALQ